MSGAGFPHYVFKLAVQSVTRGVDAEPAPLAAELARQALFEVGMKLGVVGQSGRGRIRPGTRGYLLKDSLRSEIVEAVRAVSQGRSSHPQNQPHDGEFPASMRDAS
jgi:hypothetical protein